MNKKLVFLVMLVFGLAFCLVFVSCGNSSLAGTWEGGGETLALSEDGTGNWDGTNITWKVENKRLVFTGRGLTFSYKYKLSGSTLTLTDDDGDSSTYTKKK